MKEAPEQTTYHETYRKYDPLNPEKSREVGKHRKGHKRKKKK